MPTPAQAAIYGGNAWNPYILPDLAARYDLSKVASTTSDFIRIDSSNRVSLLADTSGNSAVNGLVLPGTTGNYASFTATTAFGTSDFSICARISTNAIGSSQAIISRSAADGCALFINTSGYLQTAQSLVANNTASTTVLAALTTYDVAYVRSGTTGTYYVNGVGAGTTTDSRNYSGGQNAIGLTDSPNVFFFNGRIFGVRTYSVALDAAGVAADAAGTVQSNCVLDVDFTTQAKLAASFTSGTRGGASAKTITINTSGATGARISGARDLYQGTTASQPIYLAHTGTNYGYLPGLSGAYYSTPDSAAVSITGDLELVARITMADYTPASSQVIIAKRSGSSGEYAWRIETNGRPYLFWYEGGVSKDATATAAPAATDGTTYWFRVTRAFSGGSATVRHYFAADNGSNTAPTSWTQIGTDVTVGSASGATDTSITLGIGAQTDNNSQFSGYVHRAQIYAGLTGTDLRADFNPALYTSGTTFTASTGEVWTLNGGSTIVTRTCLYFDGSDDYMKAASFSLSQPESVYFTGQQVSWTLNDVLYDGNSTDTMQMYQKTSTPTVAHSAGGLLPATSAFAVQVAGILRSVFNGASSTIGVNRGTLTTGNSGTGTPNGFTLGASGSAAGPGNQTSSEVLIYSAAHDTSTQDRVAQYEGRKWRIAGV